MDQPNPKLVAYLEELRSWFLRPAPKGDPPDPGGVLETMAKEFPEDPSRVTAVKELLRLMKWFDRRTSPGDVNNAGPQLASILCHVGVAALLGGAVKTLVDRLADYMRQLTVVAAVGQENLSKLSGGVDSLEELREIMSKVTGLLPEELRKDGEFLSGAYNPKTGEVKVITADGEELAPGDPLYEELAPQIRRRLGAPPAPQGGRNGFDELSKAFRSFGQPPKKGEA